MSGKWRKGARSGYPADKCPACSKGGAIAVDFKKMGEHSAVVCFFCNTVSLDGDKLFDLDVFNEPEVT